SALGLTVAWYVSLAVGASVGLLLFLRSTSDWFGTVTAAPDGGALWHYTWPVLIADTLNLLRSTGVLFLLAVFVPAGAVGQFSAALLIAVMFQMPLLVFEPLFMPMVSHML